MDREGRESSVYHLLEKMKDFQFLVDNEKLIRRLCKYISYDREDELWDVAVDKVPRIVELFDPSRGLTLRGWVMNSLRRYLWKWMRKEGKRQARLEPLYDEHGTEATFELDDKDVVYSVMEKLSPYDRQLLTLHLVAGKSFQEIADMLGCAVGTAHGHYSAALRRARSRAT